MAVDLPENPHLLFVSTYPPTRCGIATFTESLLGALSQSRGGAFENGVIRLVPGWDTSVSLEPEVVAEPDVTSPDWLGPLESWCTDFDLLWIQHEFGIFGADDGASVLDLCRRSPLPIAATLHTVLLSPTDRQRMILEGLAEAAQAIVVMSRSAGRLLTERFDVDPDKVHLVPHGAQFLPQRRHRPHHRRQPHHRHQPTIVNWGLIGPGKGLETGIRAISRLRHLVPPPNLVIRGTTHPNVKRHEGDAYRERLLGLIADLGVDDFVQIRDGYMTSGELEALIRSADLVLLPYDTTEQVTSGVLVDAIGAGLPVVSTEFPHAVEMLSGGAGRVVPQRDPEAMAAAIEGLLTDASALEAAAAEASRVGRDFAWPKIALSYERLARQVVARDGTRLAIPT